MSPQSARQTNDAFLFVTRRRYGQLAFVILFVALQTALYNVNASSMNMTQLIPAPRTMRHFAGGAGLHLLYAEIGGIP